MSTQPIEHKVYGYTQRQPRKPREDVEFPLGSEESKKRQTEVAKPGSGGKSQIGKLLAGVAPKLGGRVSFSDISKYRDQAQAAWNEEVAEDLQNLGVDVNTSFRLMYDPAGAVSVAGEHLDKDMINAYFTTNPSKVNELGEILQYGKLVSVAEDQLSSQEMNQTLSIGAMAQWYGANMDTSTLLSGGGIVFGSGGAVYKGLDIRV